MRENYAYSEQFPLRLGANLADEVGGTIRPKDIRPFNVPEQKGLMDTIYPWWWEEREWPRRGVITEWFYNPLKGQPRYIDVNLVRQLARSEWVAMCCQTIRREITSTPWQVVPKDPKYKDDTPAKVQREIDYVTYFLNDCNPNHETIETLVSMAVEDLLELDAGTFTKGFDQQSYLTTPAGGLELAPRGERNLVEMWARDGGSFLKETDVNGVVYRYWQYSYLHPAVAPIEFDINEVGYFMQYPRSYSVYGWSPLQSMDNILNSLINSAAWNTNFFSEATLPSGMISVNGMNPEELERFRQYFRTEIKGRWHRVAVVNTDVKYVPFALTNRDMQWLDGQKWYAKLVMAMFSITPTELGFTDDVRATGKAMGAQEDVQKRKSTLPILRLVEQTINNFIISELSQNVMFQFKPVDRNEELMQIDVDNKDMQLAKITVNDIRKKRGLGGPYWWGDEPLDIIKARILRGEPIPPIQLPGANEEQATEQTPMLQRSFDRVVHKGFDENTRMARAFGEVLNHMPGLAKVIGAGWPPIDRDTPPFGAHTQDDSIPHTQDDNAKYQKAISGNRIGIGKEQRDDYLGSAPETIPGANARGQIPTAIGRKPSEYDQRDGMINPTDVGLPHGAYPDKTNQIDPNAPKPIPSVIGTRSVEEPRFYPGAANNATRLGSSAGDYEHQPYDDTIDVRAQHQKPISEMNKPPDGANTYQTRVVPECPHDAWGEHPWDENDTMGQSLQHGHLTGMNQERNPASQVQTAPNIENMMRPTAASFLCKELQSILKEYAEKEIDEATAVKKAQDFADKYINDVAQIASDDISKAFHKNLSLYGPDTIGKFYETKTKLIEDFKAALEEQIRLEQVVLGEGSATFPTSQEQTESSVINDQKEHLHSTYKDMRYDTARAPLLGNLPTNPLHQDAPEHDLEKHDPLPEEPRLNSSNPPMEAGPRDTLDEYQLDRLRHGPAGPAATLPEGKGTAWQYPGPSEEGDRQLIEGKESDHFSTSRVARSPLSAVGPSREPVSEVPLAGHLQSYPDQNPLRMFEKPEDVFQELRQSRKDLDLGGTLEDQIERFGKFTSETGKEFGALLMRRAGQLVLDFVQVGEDKEIDIKPTRPLAADEEILGSYHQHPHTNDFSVWDMLSFLHTGWEQCMILHGADDTIVVAIKTPQTKPITEDPEQLREQYDAWSNTDFSKQYGFILYRGSLDNLEEAIGNGKD